MTLYDPKYLYGDAESAGRSVSNLLGAIVSGAGSAIGRAFDDWQHGQPFLPPQNPQISPTLAQQLWGYLPQDRVGDLGAGGPGAAYGNRAGAAALPSGGQAQIDPQQALVTQRAMEDAENRRTILALRKLQANAPSGGRAAINQNFYKGLGLDTDIFNSASGPYGQMQYAAIQTAGARAARDIARIEAETARQATQSKTATANRLIDAILSGGSGGIGALGTGGVPLTGVKTDYGAGVQLSPIFLRSDLSRFRMR